MVEELCTIVLSLLKRDENVPSFTHRIGEIHSQSICVKLQTFIANTVKLSLADLVIRKITPKDEHSEFQYVISRLHHLQLFVILPPLRCSTLMSRRPFLSRKVVFFAQSRGDDI